MKSHESSPDTQYRYLHNNTESRLISGGVNRSTGVESFRVESTPIPVSLIERRYMQNCDTLAGIYDGSIVKSENFLEGAARYPDEPVDHALYLDKSSRPVHLLMRKAWDRLSDGDMPKASYRNIDKGNWIGLMSPDTENIDKPEIDRISLDNAGFLGEDGGRELRLHIARLRATYLSRSDLEKLDEENILTDVWDYPTILDGKRVAIVDEVKSSGATLKIADMLLREAVPEARFEPVYWSTPNLLRWNIYDNEGNVVDREFMASTVPVWYDPGTNLGRGIRDINPEESLSSQSKLERVGAFVLGRRYIDGVSMDKRSIDIRSDLEDLASRFLQGEIDYAPSIDRSDQDVERRIEEYYGIPFKEYIRRIRQRR